MQETDLTAVRHADFIFFLLFTSTDPAEISTENSELLSLLDLEHELQTYTILSAKVLERHLRLCLHYDIHTITTCTKRCCYLQQNQVVKLYTRVWCWVLIADGISSNLLEESRGFSKPIQMNPGNACRVVHFFANAFKFIIH